MGLMCSWLAVKGANRSELLDELRLVETGAEVNPALRDSTFSCAGLGGWVIVFSHYFAWADRERVRRLSRLGLTVGCRFDEKVDMESAAYAAQDGEELWYVFHVNGLKPPGIYRLDVSGDLPPAFSAIRDRLFKQQEEADRDGWSVDYVHSIPEELAGSVCGFRVDQNTALFRALNEIETPEAQDRRGWEQGLLARLFAHFSRR